jgi:hypothetical protein
MIPFQVQELHGSPWLKKKSKLLNGPQSSSATMASGEIKSLRIGSPHISQSPKLIASERDASKADKPPRFEKGPLARPIFNRRASHDLFECIESTKHKRFSEDDAKYIFAQVVDVVMHLYERGISHCDIKDENIIISSDLRVSVYYAFLLSRGFF